jgi:predicted Zn-dependent peptidase
MTSWIPRASLIALAAWFASAPQAGEATAFQLPPARRVTLPNGLSLILVEKHSVPLASFSILVRAGGLEDPAGKEGLASLTADLLRRGTANRTAEALAAELDQVGGTLEFGVGGYDCALGHAEFLVKDLAVGLDLLSDVLMHPAFPQAEVDKRVRQWVDELKEAKDRPQAVLHQYFNAALFRDHPYGRPWDGDEQSVGAIAREDVAQFYTRHYRPQATILAAVGDFETEAMVRELGKVFGAWSTGLSDPGGTARATVPKPVPFKGRRLVLVDKPDATQTFFMIGNTGIPRTHPDRVVLAVLNTAFGGRFTSILNDALRVNSGLTYGARSQFEESRDGGEFRLSSYTRNAATVQALDMVLDLLARLHRDGLSEAQLKSVQAYMKGQFPPTIETTDQLARQLAELAFYGLDEREVNDYFARLDALTVADLRRAIAEHIPTNDLVMVLIGKAAEIKEALAKYAPAIEVRAISQAGFR